MLTVAVSYENLEQRLIAEKLAADLGLPLVKEASAGYQALLMVTQKQLELRQCSETAPGPIFVDFTEGKNAFRVKAQNLKTELLAKAVHIKGRPQLRIIDATAGFGKDAFILANLGHRVELIERNPIVAALLEDGLNRLKKIQPDFSLFLSKQDAVEYCSTLAIADYPDIVYLDPMFPERQKSALVKKEMRLLQMLIGAETDADELLPIARQIAHYKVVVKRPKAAPYLAETKPSYSLTGKINRFDIYVNSNKLDFG